MPDLLVPTPAASFLTVNHSSLLHDQEHGTQHTFELGAVLPALVHPVRLPNHVQPHCLVFLRYCAIRLKNTIHSALSYGNRRALLWQFTINASPFLCDNIKYALFGVVLRISRSRTPAAILGSYQAVERRRMDDEEPHFSTKEEPGVNWRPYLDLLALFLLLEEEREKMDTMPMRAAAGLLLPPIKEQTESYSTDEESYFDEVGYLFESNQPVRLEQFQWANSSVAVCLHVADEEPGNIQSGQYLWPAANLLAEYIVRNQESIAVESVVELGCGCGLASLTSLQVWKETIQYLVMTDHDPNVLARARDNLETTVQRLIENANTDDELNALINSVASIPVDFESLEWGDVEDGDSILRNGLLDHTGGGTAHLVLGSDVIYCVKAVGPLLQSASQLMDPVKGRFWLAQSMPFNTEIETALNDASGVLGLERRTLLQDGHNRILEFFPAPFVRRSSKYHC